MKVLLIMPYNSDLIHAVSLPLGLISIATHLNANGHEAKICDMSVSNVNIKRVFEDFSPDVIGISLSSVKHLSGALHISKKLGKKGVPIVWGGTFCDTVDTELVLKNKNVDCISFCEGEETWLKIANNLQLNKGFEGIKGIAYKDSDGKIIVTPHREFIDLTTLSILDYSLVDVKAYQQYLYGCNNLMYVYLSKGCPCKCTFCANQITHRCTYRRRSLDHFMQETKTLVEKYGVDGLYFCDEICFLTKEQLYEVCDAFEKSGLKFHWGFQTRIGVLSEAEFQRCYDCGCRWIDFGIESGNKQQLEKMNKAIPYDEIVPTFDICDKIGIISLANFIVGLPEETDEQLIDTVNLAKSIKATQRSFLQYCISPKTQMSKYALDKGLIKHPFKKLSDYKKVDFFLSRTENLSYIKRKEIEVVQSYFLWQAIFKKDYSEEAHSYDLFIKHIKTLFRRLMFLPIHSAIVCLFEFAFLALRFFADTHFYPKIQKKYGLK